MDLCNRFRVHLAMALLLNFSILTEHSSASSNQSSTAERPPSHLSWTSNNTRFDFVFNTETPIKNFVKHESDANNFIADSLPKCINYSACLFKNGTFEESFQVNNSPHESIFTPAQENRNNLTSLGTYCDKGNIFKIVHYCSTHWNAPVYLTGINCVHIIEWHSPMSCFSDSINQEHPCYTHDPNGKLIDLTSLILSNGSSYNVDLSATDNNKVKKFRLNICNEAHDDCGPNVSSCYLDEQLGHVETGYNNLTSIRYDTKDNAVLLTSLGLYKHQCKGGRIETVIRFMCKNTTSPWSSPKLVRSTACENIIEWSTMRACPVSKVSSPGTECKLKYEPLGVDIDIMKLTGNRTMIAVPDITLLGKKKKMILGLCKGLPRSLLCEGKMISTTSACLLDATDNSPTRAANNSQIVGSVTKSFIKLSDDRIYMESFAPNKTCIETIRDSFNVTQKVGTRLEFFCSTSHHELPVFLGYDDCTYVFEWGSPLMCLETLTKPSNKTEKFDETKSVILEDEIHLTNVNIKDVLKDDNRKKETTRHEEKSITINNTTPKMNSAHKYFMISLILLSFVAFIVIIFVLDKKTRLRVTLRQARQAFQPNQQTYSRVVNDLDL